MAKPNMPGSNFWECQMQRRGKTFFKYWEFQQIWILISWYISIMLNRSRHCVYVTLASSFLFRESFWKVCVPIEVFFEPTEKAGKDGKVKQGERKQRHLWINIQFLILGWFLFILGFLKYGRRLKETNKKKSMRFLFNHFVFKLIQKWELRKVHNQNLIFPLFQILGSRNREMFPHLYSANPSLPGMQPQPQDPVRAIFFSLVLKVFFVHCYISITSLSGGRWWWRSYNMDSFEEQKCSSISRQWKNHEHCKWTLQLMFTVNLIGLCSHLIFFQNPLILTNVQGSPYFKVLVRFLLYYN